MEMSSWIWISVDWGLPFNESAPQSTSLKTSKSSLHLVCVYVCVLYGNTIIAIICINANLMSNPFAKHRHTTISNCIFSSITARHYRISDSPVLALSMMCCASGLVQCHDGQKTYTQTEYEGNIDIESDQAFVMVLPSWCEAISLWSLLSCIIASSTTLSYKIAM